MKEGIEINIAAWGMVICAAVKLVQLYEVAF